MDDKKTIIKWSSNHNLQLIVSFHERIRGLLKEEYQAISKKNENDPGLQDYEHLDEYAYN